MNTQIITLRNNFKISHGDFERIKEALGDPSLISCVVQTDIIQKVMDPAKYEIRGSNATFLREKGILDDDNEMSEEMWNVAYLAYDCDTDQEIDIYACRIPNFDNLTL